MCGLLKTRDNLKAKLGLVGTNSIQSYYSRRAGFTGKADWVGADLFDL
jgi:hypothetical protein